MKGNIWIASIPVLILFSVGFTLVFYSKAVRDFYFKSFKEGLENYGMTIWKDKYPEAWFFRVFGIIAFIFGILLLASIWKRSRG